MLTPGYTRLRFGCGAGISNMKLGTAILGLGPFLLKLVTSALKPGTSMLKLTTFNVQL